MLSTFDQEVWLGGTQLDKNTIGWSWNFYAPLVVIKNKKVGNPWTRMFFHGRLISNSNVLRWSTCVRSSQIGRKNNSEKTILQKSSKVKSSTKPILRQKKKFLRNICTWCALCFCKHFLRNNRADPSSKFSSSEKWKGSSPRRPPQPRPTSRDRKRDPTDLPVNRPAIRTFRKKSSIEELAERTKVFLLG